VHTYWNCSKFVSHSCNSQPLHTSKPLFDFFTPPHHRVDDPYRIANKFSWVITSAAPIPVTNLVQMHPWGLVGNWANYNQFFIYTFSRKLTKRSGRATDFCTWWPKWCSLVQGCAFLGFGWYSYQFRGSNHPKTPILAAWIGVFKPNMPYIETFIVSKLLHRLQPNFAQWQRPLSTPCGWSMHETNQRWCTDTIIKNKKNCDISVMDWLFVTKFCTVMHLDTLDPISQ